MFHASSFALFLLKGKSPATIMTDTTLSHYLLALKKKNQVLTILIRQQNNACLMLFNTGRMCRVQKSVPYLTGTFTHLQQSVLK